MPFVAAPYERFVDDLLTSLTGGQIREEHQFIAGTTSYALASANARADSVKVFGQRNESYLLFDPGADYDVDSSKTAIVWRPAGKLPDDHSSFYVNYYRADDLAPLLTDRNPGSVTTTLAEAFARELAVLHQEMQGIYQSGFVDTASGTALDHIVALLGIERKDARFATGQVLFKRSTPAPGDISIPSGTAVSTDQGQNFETTDERRLRKGQLVVDVPIRAQVEGGPGQVPPGAIKNINRPIFGIESVSNDAATAFSSQRETDADLRRRVKGTLERAGRSTLEAIKYALIESNPQLITDANIQVTEGDTAGAVDVKIGLGAADADLVRSVEAAILASRPAGVRVRHNLPTQGVPGGAAVAGISRDQASADMQAQNLPPDVRHLPDAVLASMAEGVLSLRVEVFLRLAQANVSAADQEMIEDGARTAITDYVSALPMGAPLIFNKLLGRIVAPDAVMDAALLVGAEGDGEFHSYTQNLATDGRKARIDDYHIFVGLMDEPVAVDVKITVESQNQAPADPGQIADGIKAGGPLYQTVSTAVSSLLGGARTKGALAQADLVAAVQPVLAAATPHLQLVEPNGLVLSGEYAESGRLMNAVDKLTFQPNEAPTLRNLTLVSKSLLDG
jgi:hypothetical protein